MNISELQPSFNDIMNGARFYITDVWKEYRAPFGIAHRLEIDKYGNSPRLLKAPFAVEKYKNRRFSGATVTTAPDGNITAYNAHYGHWSRRDGYTIHYTFTASGIEYSDVFPLFRT